MNKLYVGFDDINDARKMNSWEPLKACLQLHIQDGGVVVIEQRYVNAPSQIIAVIDSVEALKDWS
jgi:hypothetical protein